MFILIGVLVATLFIITIIALIHWIMEGELPVVFKNSRRKYNALQKSSIEIRKYPYRKQIKDFPTITLDQFKDFYYINPSSWTLRNCRVFKNYDNEMSFTFTYEEWKKYVGFKKQVEKEKDTQKKTKEQQRIKKEQNETTRKILESVQKDIDSIRAEQQKNINETVELIKGVKL